MASISKVWIVEYRDPAGRKCKSTTPGATRHKYQSAKLFTFYSDR
jgi:hypothetical protein